MSRSSKVASVLWGFTVVLLLLALFCCTAVGMASLLHRAFAQATRLGSKGRPTCSANEVGKQECKPCKLKAKPPVPVRRAKCDLLA